MSAPVPDHAKSSVAPRRRWRWIGLFLLGSFVGGAWFAPEIVSQTSLRHSVANWATHGLPLRVELGPTSLGWMKPIVLRELRISDSDGQALLDVKELRSERTLWQLAIQRGVLGTFTLTEPKGHVVLRAEGSNVEDVLAILLSGSTTDPAPEFRVEIVNARVEFEHPALQRKSAIESLDLKVSSGVKGIELVVAEIPSKSAAVNADAGRFAAYFGKLVDQPEAGGESKSDADGAQQLLVRAKDWRLDWLNPILTRWQPKGEVSGVLSADWRMKLGADNSGKGDVAINELSLAGLNGMGADRLRLDEIRLRGNVSMKGERLILEEAELRTEVGTLTASGDLPLGGWSFTSREEALGKI